MLANPTDTQTQDSVLAIDTLLTQDSVLANSSTQDSVLANPTDSGQRAR